MKTRFDPIGTTVDVFFREDAGPAARSRILAQFAREQRDIAVQKNRQVLGRTPVYDIIVDGSVGGSEDSVKPDGRVVYDFKTESDVLGFIMAELQKISPRRAGSGRYANSHEVFADGSLVANPSKLPPADEYTVVNLQPYARKIEGDLSRPPASKSAPDGVYEVVARRARAKFGASTKITFSYRAVVGSAIVPSSKRTMRDLRNPAIIVKLR